MLRFCKYFIWNYLIGQITGQQDCESSRPKIMINQVILLANTLSNIWVIPYRRSFSNTASRKFSQAKSNVKQESIFMHYGTIWCTDTVTFSQHLCGSIVCFLHCFFGMTGSAVFLVLYLYMSRY
jgi:hypothetical protein